MDRAYWECCEGALFYVWSEANGKIVVIECTGCGEIAPLRIMTTREENRLRGRWKLLRASLTAWWTAGYAGWPHPLGEERERI